MEKVQSILVITPLVVCSPKTPSTLPRPFRVCFRCPDLPLSPRACAPPRHSNRWLLVHKTQSGTPPPFPPARPPLLNSRFIVTRFNLLTAPIPAMFSSSNEKPLHHAVGRTRPRPRVPKNVHDRHVYTNTQSNQPLRQHNEIYRETRGDSNGEILTTFV